MRLTTPDNFRIGARREFFNKIRHLQTSLQCLQLAKVPSRGGRLFRAVGERENAAFDFPDSPKGEREHVSVLNVAGPGTSKWPGAGDYAYGAIFRLLELAAAERE